MPERSRNWTFTINNYTNEDETKLMQMQMKGKLRCFMYGKEIGASGTPHLQGFLVARNAMTLTALKKLLKTAHLEVMKGTIAQNKEYCSKDGDVVEKGDFPISNKEKGKKEKERWKNILQLAKNGDLDTLEEEEPRVAFNCYRKIEYIAAKNAARPGPIDVMDNRWYYGDSGTGKSKSARTEFPDAYIKLNNKWWDGYNGEETVIIDDLDKYDVKLGGHLKRWSDHYTFPAEFKGGVKYIRPKRIIVTSNYTPEEIWDDEKTTGPLNRRFARKHFKKLKVQDHPHEPTNASYAPNFNPPPMDI